jgi:Ca2+/Na+ antiporter
MDIVYQTLVVLHLLGVAAILGGVVTELMARRDGVPKLALHGAGLQVLTGVVLVGLASSGAVDVNVNNAKAAVKLSVAVAVLVLAFLSRRKVSMGRIGLRAVGLLALANVLVAVYW